LLLETSLYSFKASKVHGNRLTLEMPVMNSMGRIVAEYTAVIARINEVIDKREVIPRHTPLAINPDFAAQHSATFRLA
jgi:hypothetical protein